MSSVPDLSVVIPSLNESANLESVLPALRDALETLGLTHEILVIEGGADTRTQPVTEDAGARFIHETAPGYGAAILRGIREAHARFVLTMDADQSHPSRFIEGLWNAREDAEIVIASRYVDGGAANQPFIRRWLSKTLNRFFRAGLSIDVHDLSSGFRLYRRNIFRTIEPRFTNFVILVEVLLLAYQRGGRILEVPFQYEPRGAGRSNAQIIRFGLDYLRLFWRMWHLRNSIHFPDYDWRAHDSRIWLQRYWQRRRFHIITTFTPPNVSTVDVGCGSSKILAALPHAVGVDMRFEKLRFMRKTNARLLQSNGCRLPFHDNEFACAISSQVIEHIPEEGGRLIDELDRVLKPGGVMILGTPDYGNWEWRVTERLYELAAPGAYAEEHVTRYTFDTLKHALESRGYTILDHAYILKGELIFKAQKPGQCDENVG